MTLWEVIGERRLYCTCTCTCNISRVCSKLLVYEVYFSLRVCPNYMHTHVYMHARTHTHTYAHAYTHTCICTRSHTHAHTIDKGHNKTMLLDGPLSVCVHSFSLADHCMHLILPEVKVVALLWRLLDSSVVHRQLRVSLDTRDTAQ